MPFPTPPGTRLAYDSNGTVVQIRRTPNNGGDWLEFHPEAVKAMNSAYGAGIYLNEANLPDSAIWSPSFEQAPSGTRWLALLFPEPLRLDGIFWAAVNHNYPPSGNGRSTSADIYTSPNTTNGTDGDWTLLGTFDGLLQGVANSPYTLPATRVITGAEVTTDFFATREFYRHTRAVHGNGIEPTLARQVRGIRVAPNIPPASYGIEYTAMILHLYGTPDTQASGDFLVPWSPTLSRRLAPGWLVWDDDVPSTSEDKSFRLKNLSTAKTANDIVLTAEEEKFFESPSAADQILFSLDSGATWTNTVTITALSALTVSPEILIRRDTPANAPLGSWSPVLKFDVGSWT